MYVKYTMIPLVKIQHIHWFIAYTYEKDIEEYKGKCLQELTVYSRFIGDTHMYNFSVFFCLHL